MSDSNTQDSLLDRIDDVVDAVEQTGADQLAAGDSISGAIADELGAEVYDSAYLQARATIASALILRGRDEISAWQRAAAVIDIE